jgi:hypothetical protein
VVDELHDIQRRNCYSINLSDDEAFEGIGAPFYKVASGLDKIIRAATGKRSVTPERSMGGEL